MINSNENQQKYFNLIVVKIIVYHLFFHLISLLGDMGTKLSNWNLSFQPFSKVNSMSLATDYGYICIIYKVIKRLNLKGQNFSKNTLK